VSCLCWSTVLGRRRYVATLRVAQPCFILLRKRPPFRDLNIERLPFNPLWGLTVVERSDVLNGLSRAFAHATPLTLPNTVLQLLQTATLSHLGAKMTQNETTPLRHQRKNTQVQAYRGEASMRARTAGGRPVCGAN
jgi:hypothetical protein